MRTLLCGKRHRNIILDENADVVDGGGSSGGYVLCLEISGKIAVLNKIGAERC